MKFEFEHGVAVVAGAAQGIGAALAMELARRGCHLALVDRDPAGLTAVADAAGSFGIRVSRHRLDIADAEAVAALPDDVLKTHDRVNLLINNAGVGLMGSFEQLTLEEFEWLFNINFWGVVRTSKAFLPLLSRESNAHLVNISSVFGLIAPVEQTAYAASKFAVRGFTDALRHEMEGTGVGVSVVHPGGIRTRIAHNARRAAFCDTERADRMADRFVREVKTTPEAAARRIVEGIERRSPRILIGRDASVIDWLSRLAPVGYWRMLKKLFEAEDHPPVSVKTPAEQKGLSHE